MKKIFLLSVIITLFITSCKKEEQSIDTLLQSKDVSVIKKYKSELDLERQGLADKIKQLNDKLEELEPNRNVPLVTTFEAKQEPFTHYLELQGSVQTKKNMLVYPETPGIITGIFVKQGQYVRKGQVIARIDDGGLANQLSQLKTGLALAKTTFERQGRLWDQKIGSEIQYLQAKANYEGRVDAVKQMQKTIGRFTINAPFSGRIDDVMKESGAVVAPGPGAEICRIVNLSNMYIETSVAESYLTTIKKGKKVEVEFPILGKTITSKVRQVGDFINPINRTFKVEVYVPNKDKSIKPNLTAKLKINDYSNKEAFLIPQSIISENAEGNKYVYIVETKDSKPLAKQVIVETGKTQGDKIEVLKGITNGMQVVIEGSRSVKNGQEVTISSYKPNGENTTETPATEKK